MTEKTKRGFASLDRDRVLEIASQGGKAAHAQGRAHEFTSEQAREAGKKGAAVKKAKRDAEELRRREAVSNRVPPADPLAASVMHQPIADDLETLGAKQIESPPYAGE